MTMINRVPLLAVGVQRLREVGHQMADAAQLEDHLIVGEVLRHELPGELLDAARGIAERPGAGSSRDVEDVVLGREAARS